MLYARYAPAVSDDEPPPAGEHDWKTRAIRAERRARAVTIQRDVLLTVLSTLLDGQPPEKVAAVQEQLAAGTIRGLEAQRTTA